MKISGNEFMKYSLECQRGNLLATVAKMRLLADKIEAIAENSKDSQELRAYAVSASILAGRIEESLK